jgi:peroxiredoxin
MNALISRHAARRAPVLVLTTALLACPLFACGRPTYPQSIGHHLLGQPLPATHTREWLNGGPLEKPELEGKVVVVKFFADYCAPCKETLPAAERVHVSHAGVVFIGVSEDQDNATAAKVIAQFGLTFPVAFDRSKVIAGKFRVSEMPRTFVADKMGVVRWVGGEGQSEAELQQAIEAAQ